jgi:acyl-coenzyme A synthetase/AMP-(fatty) acid ligase
MAGYDGLSSDDVLRDGWYVGGDLGILSPDGVLTVLGRREDAILKGGVWTQPAEIEEAAVSLDDVAEAGAVGLEDGRILLAVVPRTGHSVDPAKLAVILSEKLPAHQHPDHILVVGELPHSQDASGGPGKLLRRHLPALLPPA